MLLFFTRIKNVEYALFFSRRIPQCLSSLCYKIFFPSSFRGCTAFPSFPIDSARCADRFTAICSPIFLQTIYRCSASKVAPAKFSRMRVRGRLLPAYVSQASRKDLYRRFRPFLGRPSSRSAKAFAHSRAPLSILPKPLTLIVTSPLPLDTSSYVSSFNTLISV